MPSVTVSSFLSLLLLPNICSLHALPQNVQTCCSQDCGSSHPKNVTHDIWQSKIAQLETMNVSEFYCFVRTVSWKGGQSIINQFVVQFISYKQTDIWDVGLHLFSCFRPYRWWGYVLTVQMKLEFYIGQIYGKSCLSVDT